jgi:hypothetical protein
VAHDAVLAQRERVGDSPRDGDARTQVCGNVALTFVVGSPRADDASSVRGLHRPRRGEERHH